MRLVDIAREKISSSIRPGDYVVDATAGNGSDCLFLAEAVTRKGKVFAFDVQIEAIKQCQQRLDEQQVLEQVRLCHCGHQQMTDIIPQEMHGKIKAIMFNLGYLPGSNQQITTTTETSLSALQQALQLIDSNGIISVVCYRGHEGGNNEYQAIARFCQQLDSSSVETIETPGPVLFVIGTRHRSR